MAEKETSTAGRVRDIKSRDLQIIQQLIRDYPNFSDLSSGDQLDRVMLVLETVCGYGAVSVQTIHQLEPVFRVKNSLNIQDHFQQSTFSVSGDAKKKYRESFETAYCLDREYKKIIANEGEESESEEPIRKKVPGKPKPLSASPKVTPRAQTVPSVSNKPSLSADPVDKPADLPKVKANEFNSQSLKLMNPFVIVAAVLVVVLISLAAVFIDL